MARRVIKTSKRLAAERQIHAAIAHFRAGDFECAITLCSAAEGQIPEPADLNYFLFARLKQVGAKNPASNGEKDDFNFSSNWMKHGIGADEVEIEEWIVKAWLLRAISNYRGTYGIFTPEMTALLEAGRRSQEAKQE